MGSSLIIRLQESEVIGSITRQFIREKTEQKTSGHPRWYGEKFDLKDENTWHEPDEIFPTLFTTKKGRQLTVTISAWKQMLMRGTKNYKMNRHPFTLLQITVRDKIGNTASETYVAYCHWFSPS